MQKALGGQTSQNSLKRTGNVGENASAGSLAIYSEACLLCLYLFLLASTGGGDSQARRSVCQHIARVSNP